MNYITASFYQEKLEIAVSPLAPQAFSYYKFQYEGFANQDGFVINKIKVIPRRKGQNVFSGYIYIVEDYWNIQSVDLSNESMIGLINIKQLYTPLKEEAWLPISHKIDIDFSMVGVKIKANYSGSVQYSDIQINKSLVTPSLITKRFKPDTIVNQEDTKQEKFSKEQEKITKILEKDDLSNRDLIKLARLAKKEEEIQKRQGKPESLEVSEVAENHYTIEKDTLRRDSVDWKIIRPVQLTEAELKSYKIKDSIIIKTKEPQPDSLKNSEKKKGKGTFSKIGHFFVKTNTYDGKKDSTFEFNHYGLIKLEHLDFNTVDGFSLRQKFRFKCEPRKNELFTISPMIAYAFDRKAFMWEVPINYNYAPLKRGELQIKAGKSSRDFATGNEMNRTLNALYSLLYRENNMKLYQKSYLSFQNKIDIANGLQFIVGSEYSHNVYLNNHTDFSLFYRDKKEYTDNFPNLNSIYDIEYIDYELFPDYKKFYFEIGFEYTPQYFYKISNGKKEMQHSKYPTFNILYRQGMRSFFDVNSGYDYIEVAAKQEFDLGMFSNLKWNISGGCYLYYSNMHFSEYKHFNTQSLLFTFKGFDNAFMCTDFYKTSTNDYFAEAHISFKTPYLLLKYLPIIRERMWNENLNLNYLYTPEYQHYWEIGYSISDILFMAKAGVFAGFEGIDYKSVGLKISFDLK
jgi:hypothetical protein